MIVPIIRAASICAALYFSYRLGVEDGKSQARWDGIKKSCADSVQEMLHTAEQELSELEAQLLRLENREGDYATVEGTVRDEIYRELHEKIESKKAHIANLKATASNF
jgi:hypothetical protein